MSQNIYDNEEFFKQYGQLRRSVGGLESAPEWPSLRALLPDMRGLRVLDLGCGYGWFCRWASQNGAASVQGIDISEKMLERAASMTKDDKITYSKADLESLELPRESFGVVYSSLSFHYLRNLDRLMMEIHHSLVPGGQLVFSVEHPIYTAPTNPGWGTDASGNKVWPVNHYLIEGQRSTDWFVSGVIKYHRTFGTYVNMLLKAGFAITHAEDWSPTDDQIAARPDLAEERERPMFLLMAARR